MNKQQRSNRTYSRFDMRSAGIVDKAIALQSAAGTSYAAVFMKSEHIHSTVILRVLLRPGERRTPHTGDLRST